MRENLWPIPDWVIGTNDWNRAGGDLISPSSEEEGFGRTTANHPKADPWVSIFRALHNCQRSEERRVGKECVSTCRSRWSPYHEKKQITRSPSLNQYYNKQTKSHTKK